MQRRVAAIVDRVRREGDRALLKYARTFDGLDGPIEVARQEIEGARRLVDPAVTQGDRPGVEEHPHSRGEAAAASVDHQSDAGRHDPPARAAARSRRLLRARRTLSAALVPADDRHSGARGRRAGRDCRLPEAGSDRDVCGARGRRLSPVSAGRRPRDCRTRLWHGDGPARGPDRRPRQRLRRRGQVSRVARLRDRFLRRPERDRRALDIGQAGVDRRGSSRASRARSRRAGDPDHAEPCAWRWPSRAKCRSSCRPTGRRDRRWRRTAASS